MAGMDFAARRVGPARNERRQRTEGTGIEDVMVVPAVPPARDESRAAQHRHVLRDRRLADAERERKRARTVLALEEQTDNAKARRVAERLHGGGKRLVIHIRQTLPSAPLSPDLSPSPLSSLSGLSPTSLNPGPLRLSPLPPGLSGPSQTPGGSGQAARKRVPAGGPPPPLKR